MENKYELPPRLIEAVKNAGERSNSNQQSPMGAKGVMQFIDSTRKDYPHDVRNPLASIDAAGKYFKDLLTQYQGNAMAAIAHYNGGNAAGNAVMEGKQPPSKETRDYLSRVKSYLNTTVATNSANAEASSSGGANNIVATPESEAKLPTYTLADVKKAGLDTSKGRLDWGKQMIGEYEKAPDKNQFASPGEYAEAKYPLKAIMYRQFMNKEITGKQIDFAKDVALSSTNIQSNILGYVNPGDSKRAFLQQNAGGSEVVHESEHVRQNRLPQDASLNNQDSITQHFSDFNSLVSLAKENRTNPAFKEAFPYANSFKTAREFAANLYQYESNLPEGMGLKQSPLYKETVRIAGKDKADAMFDAAIRNTNVTEPNAIPISDEVIKKATANPNSSYARQVFEYLKQHLEQ